MDETTEGSKPPQDAPTAAPSPPSETAGENGPTTPPESATADTGDSAGRKARRGDDSWRATPLSALGLDPDLQSLFEEVICDLGPVPVGAIPLMGHVEDLLSPGVALADFEALSTEQATFIQYQIDLLWATYEGNPDRTSKLAYAATAISDLPIGERIRGVLAVANIHTVADILALWASGKNLLGVLGVGKLAVVMIETALDERRESLGLDQADGESTAEKTEPEQKPEPESAPDPWKEAVQCAGRRCGKTADALLVAARSHKEAKKAYDAAVAELLNAVDNQRQGQLTFPGEGDGEETETPADKLPAPRIASFDEAAYRAVAVESLDIPQGIVKRLKAQGFQNVGDIADFTKKDNPLVAITGIGEDSAGKIEAALDAKLAEITGGQDNEEGT